MNLIYRKGLSNYGIILSVVFVLLLILIVTFGTQYYIDKNVTLTGEEIGDRKASYELSKLEAEISKIRSDTTGSLFWLKLVGLFVTVGGAVGGYLIGQSRTTMAKLDFEDRKNVDEVYQSMVQELADSSPILRATASVKLGTILKSFPTEWNVSAARKDQIIQLTKQVLAAALSIELEQKVLKTLTISVALDKPEPESNLASVRDLDFSGANAHDAYWARCDFQNSDFYASNLSRVSFRKSNLTYVQFREAILANAVLDESNCNNTNFKLANLRQASFNKASLEGVNFEDAKVYGTSLKDAFINNIPDCEVDISKEGDGSVMLSVHEWIKKSTV